MYVVVFVQVQEAIDELRLIGWLIDSFLFDFDVVARFTDPFHPLNERGWNGWFWGSSVTEADGMLIREGSASLAEAFRSDCVVFTASRNGHRRAS